MGNTSESLLEKWSNDMSNLFWLTDAQIGRLEPFFPKAHVKPRIDDKRVLSGIIFINRNGLRWRNAPAEYRPPKTLYNWFVTWSRKGVFARILIALARSGEQTNVLMIDATHLKAHCTASSLGSKKGQSSPDRSDQRRSKLQTACCD